MGVKRWWWIVFSLAVIGTRVEGSTGQLDSLVSPGPLARAHSELTGLRNCTSCHTPGKGIADDKCLACHRDLKARIEQDRGYHRGKLECATCHADHQGLDVPLVRWDRARFDHTETGYPLTGLHARFSARCEACHRPPNAPARTHSPSFLLEDARCVACHQDVHRGQLGEDCSKCHSVDVPFDQAPFDHNRARFRLSGAHQKVSCEKCHPNQKWRGLAFGQCADCHRDPHRPSLGIDCQRCHSEAAWTKFKFDHQTTRFPLLGSHADVLCSRCHEEQKFRGIAFGECRDCHKDDPHKGQFQEDCSRCHSESGWKKTRFDHDATHYALRGKHADLACETCHPKQKYRGVAFAECRDCHEKDPHFGQFSEDCAQCHRVEGFDKLLFDHQKSAYPLTGKHVGLACSKCHALEADAKFPQGVATAVRYRPLQTRCGGCHVDPHFGQFQKDKDCESCHATEGFSEDHLRFEHDRDSRFPLQGRHRQVLCRDCHRIESGPFPDGPDRSGTTVRYKPVSPLCVACHDDVHDEAWWKSSKKSMAIRCESCHSAETFELHDFDHDQASLRLTGAHQGVACERCHDFAVARQRRFLLFRTGNDRGCRDCHRTPHMRGMERCADCHNVSNWSVGR